MEQWIYDVHSFGYMTNTKVKLVVVIGVTDAPIKDMEMKNLFRRIHNAYVNLVSNPFFDHEQSAAMFSSSALSRDLPDDVWVLILNTLAASDDILSLSRYECTCKRSLRGATNNIWYTAYRSAFPRLTTSVAYYKADTPKKRAATNWKRKLRAARRLISDWTYRFDGKPRQHMQEINRHLMDIHGGINADDIDYTGEFAVDYAFELGGARRPYMMHVSDAMIYEVDGEDVVMRRYFNCLLLEYPSGTLVNSRIFRSIESPPVVHMLDFTRKVFTVVIERDGVHRAEAYKLFEPNEGPLFSVTVTGSVRVIPHPIIKMRTPDDVPSDYLILGFIHDGDAFVTHHHVTAGVIDRKVVGRQVEWISECDPYAPNLLMTGHSRPRSGITIWDHVKGSALMSFHDPSESVLGAPVHSIWGAAFVDEADGWEDQEWQRPQALMLASCGNHPESYKFVVWNLEGALRLVGPQAVGTVMDEGTCPKLSMKLIETTFTVARYDDSPTSFYVVIPLLYVLTSSGTLRVHNLDTGALLKEIVGLDNGLGLNRGPDGEMVVSGSD
ncbi:Trafficking protein particle complex subunit 2-like protein, partial [Irineochytrium annulatum]